MRPGPTARAHPHIAPAQLKPMTALAAPAARSCRPSRAAAHAVAGQPPPQAASLFAHAAAADLLDADLSGADRRVAQARRREPPRSPTPCRAQGLRSNSGTARTPPRPKPLPRWWPTWAHCPTAPTLARWRDDSTPKPRGARSLVMNTYRALPFEGQPGATEIKARLLAVDERWGRGEVLAGHRQEQLALDARLPVGRRRPAARRQRPGRAHARRPACVHPNPRPHVCHQRRRHPVLPAVGLPAGLLVVHSLRAQGQCAQ